MEIYAHLQQYNWGKVGKQGKVAQLIQSSGLNFNIVETENYAELWFGTHPSGPCTTEKKELLEAWIEENVQALGTAVVSEFGARLPFLLKVLSVGKALSIQIHPSKEQAVKLHKEFPQIYKDENHKPELAIALSKFEAFCGFKQLDQIQKNFKDVKEIRAILDDSAKVSDTFLNSIEEDVENFKILFHKIMTAPQNLVEEQLFSLNERIKSMNEADLTEELRLFARVYEQFPGDNGCVCAFIFNYVCLEVGECIYIGANEPHAYLNGDCIECMACSDNVVRAGLTPKFKDIPTLCSLLNYNFESPKAKLLLPIRENNSSQVYLPPVSDFAVAKVEVQSKAGYVMKTRPSASICLFISGRGKFNEKDILPGKSFFLRADEIVHVINEDDCVLELYQAFANVS